MRVSIDGEVDPDADWAPFQQRFHVDLLPIHGQQSVTVELRKSPGSIPMSTDPALYGTSFHARPQKRR